MTSDASRAAASAQQDSISRRSRTESPPQASSTANHSSHVLPVPLPSQGRNTPGALEHLSGTMHVRVGRRGRTVWAGTSVLAGLEHAHVDPRPACRGEARG